jgi:acetylornithine deacetylase/succinyl-diaminopimelate desuccinylase-like protein
LVVALLVQIVIGGFFVWLASTDFDWFRSDDDAPKQQQTAPAAPAAAAVMPRANVDRFDGARAFALLRRQVEEYGPRPAGSASLRRLALRLRALLPEGRFEDVPGHPGLRNVVGRVPGTKPAVVLGAHYDTKDEPPGFVGANDGAGGTAAVVELARVLKRANGEEAPKGCEPFLDCGVRGAKAYAKRHGKHTRALVLLDFIAEKGTRIPREQASDVELWARLRRAARRVGVQRVFPDAESGAVSDDHTPFLQRGIPAIDLIDFTFEQWHTVDDDMDVVSSASLDAVGEAVAQLLLDWRR